MQIYSKLLTLCVVHPNVWVTSAFSVQAPNALTFQRHTRVGSVSRLAASSLVGAALRGLKKPPSPSGPVFESAVFQNATVEVLESETVDVLESETVEVYASAAVEVLESETVEVLESETVEAFASATVEGFASATVEVLESESLEVLDKAIPSGTSFQAPKRTASTLDQAYERAKSSNPRYAAYKEVTTEIAAPEFLARPAAIVEEVSEKVLEKTKEIVLEKTEEKVLEKTKEIVLEKTEEKVVKKTNVAQTADATVWDMLVPDAVEQGSLDKTVQGGTLKTWSFPSPSVERVQVVMNTNGRPLNADVDLWQGPNNAPQKMRVFIEDGSVRPFSCVIETPKGQNSIAIQNTGELQFPLNAVVGTDVEDADGNAIAAVRKTLTDKSHEEIIQGSAVKTFSFPHAVERVHILLETNGRPLYARVELLQGPNNDKQVVELYTENGLKRPFSAVFETPGIGNVVRVINTAPVEFPLTAIVKAHQITEGETEDNLPYRKASSSAGNSLDQ